MVSVSIARGLVTQWQLWFCNLFASGSKAQPANYVVSVKGLSRPDSARNSEAALLRRDGSSAITPGGENNHSNRRQAVNVSSPTAKHNAPSSRGCGITLEAQSEWKPLNIRLSFCLSWPFYLFFALLLISASCRLFHFAAFYTLSCLSVISTRVETLSSLHLICVCLLSSLHIQKALKALSAVQICAEFLLVWSMNGEIPSLEMDLGARACSAAETRLLSEWTSLSWWWFPHIPRWPQQQRWIHNSWCCYCCH